jgi:hypothetical protein
VIRQAISCDICGTEKKQTNHWFVAYDQGGELRIGGWTSKNRLRPGAQHLCGQTCLHKLVDDFMARSISSRPVAAAAESPAEEMRPIPTDTSLTAPASGSSLAERSAPAAVAEGGFESSARLISPPAAAPQAARPTLAQPSRPPLRAPVEFVPPARR